MHIGSAINLARTNAELTRKQLAERTGLSPSSITRIEKEERQITVQTAKALAEALGLRLSQLVALAESIRDPEDRIKQLQRDLYLSVQPFFAQRGILPGQRPAKKKPRPRARPRS